MYAVEICRSAANDRPKQCLGVGEPVFGLDLKRARIGGAAACLCFIRAAAAAAANLCQHPGQQGLMLGNIRLAGCQNGTALY